MKKMTNIEFENYLKEIELKYSEIKIEENALFNIQKNGFLNLLQMVGMNNKFYINTDENIENCKIKTYLKSVSYDPLDKEKHLLNKIIQSIKNEKEGYGSMQIGWNKKDELSHNYSVFLNSMKKFSTLTINKIKENDVLENSIFENISDIKRNGIKNYKEVAENLNKIKTNMGDLKILMNGLVASRTLFINTVDYNYFNPDEELEIKQERNSIIKNLNNYYSKKENQILENFDFSDDSYKIDKVDLKKIYNEIKEINDTDLKPLLKKVEIFERATTELDKNRIFDIYARYNLENLEEDLDDKKSYLNKVDESLREDIKNFIINKEELFSITSGLCKEIEKKIEPNFFKKIDFLINELDNQNYEYIKEKINTSELNKDGISQIVNKSENELKNAIYDMFSEDLGINKNNKLIKKAIQQNQLVID